VLVERLQRREACTSGAANGMHGLACCVGVVWQQIVLLRGWQGAQLLC
jgi:hypothetical protein